MKTIALRHIIKGVIIASLLVNVKIGSAATLPTWVSNLPLWQWYAIPNTALSSVEPSPRPCGINGPRSKIGAWNGATLKREGSVYMIGAAGGHGDYCGNEVDALTLNTATPQWVQLSPPSPNAKVINRSPFYLDLKPSATHTYYATQFINARNRLFVVGGGSMNMDSLPSAPAGWPYAWNDGYSFSFNMATNSWDAPEYVAKYTGGGDAISALVVKHPVTEDIYLNRYAAGWWKWTQAANSWSRVSSNNEAGNYAGAAIDPIRNRMLIVGSYNGGQDPRVRDLNGTQVSVSFGGLGAPTLRLKGEPGVIYDEANDKFLVFANEGTQIRVYRVDAANWVIDSPSISGTIPSVKPNGIQNSVQYVPELGGVVIANNYYGNVFFMRTSSAGAPTLPTPPPTSGDTQAPTVPINLSASAPSSTQITLTWSTASDNVGVAGYRIYRGGAQIATVSGTSYQDSGLSAGTTYAYTVAAYDAAGNASAQSASVSAATLSVQPPIPSDTQAPTAPVNLSASALSSSQINLTWSAASDNVGVAGYRIYRGGTQIATASGTSYQDSGLSAGTTYAYTLAAYDAAGNASAQSASASATTQTVAATPPPLPIGTQITSFQLTSPTGGTSLPFTIGLGFKKGDIPDTPALNIPPSQVIVKSRWNDGSAKMAIASGAVTLAAGTPSTITVSSSTASSGTNLTPADIQAANPQATVSLGSYGTVNLSSLLATPFRTWISGPQMVEAHYRSNVGTDATLAVWFHVRLYKSGRVWVRAIVENGYMDKTKTDKSYIPSVIIGGTTIFNNGGATLAHYSHTRWMQEGWIGGNPQITPKHDSTYLINTKLVPNYWKRNPSTTTLDNLVQTYTPMANAGLTPSMGNAGFQRMIGLLPLWDALYATTGDARAYRSVLANSSSLNSYPVVWRDPNTKLIPKPTDWPSFTLSTYNYTAGAYTWEMNHAPSEGYLAYLLTGDYWHYETMMMNSAINYLARNYNTGTGTNRLLIGETRGTAWNFRTLVQASALAATGDAVAADYKTLLANNVTQWKAKVDALGGVGIGYLYEYNINAYADGAIAPWQQHFWIQSLGMGYDIEPLADMTNYTAVRDFMYRAVVGILGDSSGFCYTNAGIYTIKIASGVTNIPGNNDPALWFTTWKQVYDASVSAGLIPSGCGSTLQGTYTMAEAATSFWGNMLPAIAYAVSHNAPGATDAWSRLTNADNWSELEASSFDNIPVWGIVPRSMTATPPSNPVPPSPPLNLRLNQ